MSNPYSSDNQNRFFSKVDFHPEGCWGWGAYSAKDGRGHFCVLGEAIYAPRYSYRLFKGEIKEEMFVLHSCDNPNCVNPEHLREGLAIDNITDMVDRGRNAKGEDQHLSKLTDQKARDIYNLKGKVSGRQLAKQYGIHPTTLTSVWRKETWKHIHENKTI